MSSIDNRIVNMEFNNKGFKEGVKSTLDSLKQLDEKLKLKDLGNKGLEKIQNGFGKLNKEGINGLSAGVETVSAKFSALGVIGATALANITNKAINAGTKMTKALTIDPIKTGLSEYETKMNSMQTIYANTSHKGTTYDDIVKALDELNAYSDKTIYNFAQMTDNIGKFTSAGVDLDKSVSSIKGLANVAAMSGVDNARAAGVMYQASQAMSKGYFQLMDWRSFSNNGMGNERFRDALIQTSEILGTGAKAAIKAAGSFDESLSKSKWLTSDVMAETLAIMAGTYDKAALLSKGFSAEQADSLLSLAKDAENAATQIRTVTQLFDTMKESVQSGWAKSWEWIIGDKEQATELLTNISKSFESIMNPMADARNKVLEQWNKGGGRDSAIQGFSNIFGGIGKVAGSVKDAFRDIFPAMTGKRLIELTKGFEKFTEKLVVSDKTAAKIKDTFKGVFSIFDIGKKAVTNLFKAFAPSAGGLFGGLTDGLLNVTSTLGRFFTSINEGINASGIFERISSSISSGLKGIGDGFLKVGDFIGNLFKSMGKMDFKPLTSFVGQIGKNFGSGIGDFFSGIGEAVSNIDLNKVLGVITSLSGLKLFKSIRGTFDGFGDSLSTFSKIGKSVGEILDSVTGRLKAMTLDINAGALLKIAVAVGILAVALSGLSSIDADDMSTAISGIMTLMAGLALTMIALNKFSGGGGKGGFLGNILGSLFGGGSAASGATGLIMLATSLLILSGALKIVSSLKPEQLITGLAGVAGSMLILVGAVKLLDGIKGKLVKAGVSMILMATALNIVASAVEKFSQINPNNMLVGLMGIAAVLTELAIFMKVAKLDNMGIKSSIGIAILAASLLILQNAVSKFGSMDVGALVQGLAGIAAVLAVTAGFSRISGSATHLLGISAALVVMGAAMHILSSSVRSMAGMQWDDMARGLTAMAGSLLILAVAVKLMSGIGLIAVGAGLIVASAGLLVMSTALKSLGGMSWEEIGRGLVALAGGLLVMGVTMAAMTGGLVGAAAMLVMSAALAVFVPQLIALSNLSWSQVGIGLVALAGAFTVLGLAALILTPIIPGLVSLAGAITLIGVGCLAAGAGVSLFATAMALLAGVGSGGIMILTQAISGLLDLLPQLGTKLGEAFVSLATALGTNMPQLGVAIGQLIIGMLEALRVAIPRFVTVALELLTAFCQSLETGIPMLLDAGIKMVLAILDGIAKNISDVVVKGTEIVLGFLDGIGKSLGPLIQAGIDLAINFIDGLANGIETNADRFNSAVERLITACINAVTDLGVSLFKGLGKSEIGAMISGVLSKAGEFGSKILQTVTNAITKAKTKATAFLKTGRDYITKMVDGIKAKASAVSTACRNMVDKAIQTVKSKASSLISAGRSLIEGFVSGIKQKAASVASAAKSVVEKAISAAKDALKINSPSKVFIEIGKFTSEGLAVGIERNTDMVSNASEGMAETAIDNVRNAISRISNAMNGNMDMNPTITPVMDLSNIESGSKLISDMMNNGNLGINATMSNKLSRGIGMIQNGDTNKDIVSALKNLQKSINGNAGNTYNINGVTYDDGSNVKSAVETLVRAAKMERRM